MKKILGVIAVLILAAAQFFGVNSEKDVLNLIQAGTDKFQEMSASKTEKEYSGELSKYFYSKTDVSMCDDLLKRDAYLSCYSRENKIPLFVAAHMTKETLEPRLKRPHRFYYDKDIPTDGRSKDSHYKRSGYDRGHMFENAAADYDKNAQIESFLFTNIIPQDPKLNRGAWKFLEKYIRTQTIKYGESYIITGAIPSKDNFLKKGHVNIPSHLYKIVYYPSINKEVVYFMPNDSSVKKEEIIRGKYTISRSELKKKMSLI